MNFGKQDKGKPTIETRDNEPYLDAQHLGVDKGEPAKPEPTKPEPKAAPTQAKAADAPPPDEADDEPKAAKQTPQEKRLEKLKTGNDPLGASSVLVAMAERGWYSVKAVNELKFGPDDVPSLEYVQEAIDILTAIRDKLLVKRTA